MADRKVRIGRAQRARQYSGAVAQETQVTPEDLQEMQSYRDYLYESATQEAAIKRARNKRRLEEIQRASGEELEALTDLQLVDRASLIQNEKEDYMPDSVFESVINSLSKTPEEYKPVKVPSSSVHTPGSIDGAPIAEKIINFIRENILIPDRNATLMEEQKEKHLEFDNYTEKAQKEAFERYKVNHNITDKSILQDGKKVISQKTPDRSELIYNALTSPEGKMSAQIAKLGNTIFDPDRNEDYRFGSARYWKDAYTRFLINLNEAQKGSFLGRIDRTAEVVSLGEDAVEYYSNLSKIDLLLQQCDELTKEIAVSPNREKIDQLMGLRQQIKDIQRLNEPFKKSADKFKQYVPDDWVDGVSTGFFKMLSDAENAIFGTNFYDWTSPIFDDADVLREKLAGFNTSDNWVTKKAILNRYKEARDKKVKQWLEGIRANQEDIDRHEADHKISDYFNYWEQHASGKILDGDTWAFKQPGLFGYSSSAWMKQIPMYGGAIAAAFATDGATVAVLAATGAGGAHSASTDENYMELRENYRPLIQRELKALGDDVYDLFIAGGFNTLSEKIIAEKTDEEIDKLIIDNFLDGIYKPTSNVQKIYEATANATHGLNALFDRDMMATDLDNLVDTGIMFGTHIPAGKLVKFIKPIGEMGSPLLGVTSKAFRMSPVGRAIAKSIDDATSFLTTVPSKIYKFAKAKAPKVIKTPGMRKAVGGIEKSVTLADHPWAKLTLATAYDNAKTFGKATMYSSLSEGIEEGKQYLHGRAFQNGELADASVSFGLDADAGLAFWNNPDWGKWYDDMVDDIKSAYVIAGIPFGLEYTHDPELVENIKGGMMGGLFQTGGIKAFQQGKEFVSQMKLNKYMLNNVMAEKASRTDLYEKAKLYAQKSLSPTDTQYVLKRFDDLIRYNDDVTDENKKVNRQLIEELKNLFNAVHQLANSPEVIERAKKLGVNRGDEKFNQFIASLALSSDILSGATENLKAIEQQIINAELITEPIYSYDLDGDRIMRKTGSVLLPYTGELQKDENGVEESKQDAVERLNSIHSMQNGIAIMIKAAQDLLAQVQLADENTNMFGNSKWSIDFLKKRLLAYIQKRLEFILDDKKDQFLNNINSIANSVSNSDVLTDLYRKLALAQVDLDYASMMYLSLMGKNSIHERQLEKTVSPNGVQLDFLYDSNDFSTTFDNIVKAYENRVKGDNALYDALEQDYVDRYHQIEKQIEDERKARYLELHPELKALERMRSTTKEPKSHISAIDNTTKKLVTYEKAKQFADLIKQLGKKKINKQSIRKALKDSRIRLDNKYEDVLLDIVRRYKNGQLNDNQFALMFVPKLERLLYKEQEQSAQAKEEQPVIQEKELKAEEEQPIEEKQPVEKQEKPVVQLEQKQKLPVELAAPVENAKPVAEVQHTLQDLKEVKQEDKKPKNKKSSVTVEQKKKLGGLVERSEVEEMSSLIAEFNLLAKELKSDNYGEESADSKMFRVVTQMAFLVLKKNPMSFKEFAEQFIDLLGDDVKPYLKMAYNGVRDFPKSESFADKLTSVDMVKKLHDELLGKATDSSEETKRVRTELVLSMIDMIHELIQKVDSIRQAPETSIDSVLRSAELFLNLANDYLNSKLSFESESQESIFKYLNQLYSNTGLLFNIAEEEHIAAQNSDKGHNKDVVNQHTDPETWMNVAILAFSFYASKIATDQQLTLDDINNLNQWIVCCKDPSVKNNSETTEKTKELYNKIMNYLGVFEDMGFDGSNTNARRAVSISRKDSQDLKSSDYNTLETGSLENCRAVNDKTLRLLDVTSEEDFLEKCSVRLVLGGSEKFDGPVKEGYPKKIYAIFTYNGIEFEPCKVWDTNSTKVSDETALFGNTVRELSEQNPNEEIVPISMGRTKGLVKEQPQGEQVSLMEAGLVKDVYSISFDNDQLEFMLTRAVPTADGGLLVRATKPNKTGKGIQDVYTYGDTSNAARAGNIVYLKRTKGSNKPYFPINLYTPMMEEGEADLIVDILTGKYTNGIIGVQAMSMPFILEGEYLGSDNGGTTLGLTAKDVLNMILPYGAFGRKGKDIFHIWHSLYNDSVVIISGKYEGESEVKNHEYNVSTVQGKERLKEDLMKYVRVNISETVMKQSLGKYVKNGNNPIAGLSEFIRSREGKSLRQRLQSGEKIRLGNSRIVFDWDDLSDNKRKNGITGLGWYVKNGFLTTKFAGMYGSLINFTGAKLKSDPESPKLKEKTPKVSLADSGTQNKPVVAEEKPEGEKVAKRPKRPTRSVGATRTKESLEKISTEESDETRTIDEVRQLLSEIIPVENLRIDVSEDYLDDVQMKRVIAVSACKPHVMGRAYADAIELYKHAHLGVAYHEAFHRISEIFLDDDERKQVYDWYKKVWKRSNDGEPSLKQLQEGTADLFMFFMEHDMLFGWNSDKSIPKNVLNNFKALLNTIIFFKNIGSFGLYKLYYSIGKGRFKEFKMDDDAKKRAENFAKEHPEGFGYELDGVTLEYILNEHDFRDMVNSLVYFVFHANNIDFGGSNIQNLIIDKDIIMQSEFYKQYANQVDENGDPTYAAEALKEAMEHFETFAPYVVSAISEFATDYTVKVEDDIEDDNEDIQSASISEHIKSSYEFSQFSRASSRVKFFFSRIDSTTTIEENGVVKRADKVNPLGLPQFIDAKQVFNDVLNQLWDVEDLSELMSRLAILSKDSPVYEQIVSRLDNLREQAYSNGYNADKESLLIQIFNVIKSNKQQFYLAQTKRVYEGRDVIGYSVSMLNTDMEYNAKNYRREWSDLFAHGGSIFVEVDENGRIRPKKGMQGDSMARYWNLLTNLDASRGKRLGIAAAFSSDEQLRSKFTMAVKENGVVVHKKINALENEQDLLLCKTKFIQILNCFGILFDKAMLDYMLRQKYGNSGFDGMLQLFQDTTVSSIMAVTQYFNLTYAIEKDGSKVLMLDESGERLNGRKIDRIFDTEDSTNRLNDDSNSNGFFGELAKYKYLYRHAHDQLSVLAAQGNKFYVISENNYITDTVAFLNRAAKFYRQGDSRMLSGVEEFDELSGWSYNIIEYEDAGLQGMMGSIIIKQILQGLVDGTIEICTLAGMKSDHSGDKGVDYTTMSTRDDYVAKMSILLSGGIIFPTMSDKKTWVFLKGFTLPGIDWQGGIDGKQLMLVVAHDIVSGKSVTDNKGRIISDDPFSYAIQNSNDVVDQLIEYFITEHEAVRQCIEEYRSLPKEKRVSNYHGGKKVKDKHGIEHVVIQGARHSSLLNLYDDNDELIPVSRVLDESGEYIDEVLEFEMLEDLFFRVREEDGETEQDLINRQRIMVNRILKHRLEEELAKIEQLGLIQKVGTGNTIFDYKNVGIDAKRVDSVYQALLSKYLLQEKPRIISNQGKTEVLRDLTDDDILRFKSLALSIVVNDAMVKSIMSKNETERIFSGHPSFFKWGYDDEGNLVDRGVDQHKRYGGMVSTGQNAALWAKGINKNYTSAEIDNEMVQSQQIEFLRENIYEGSLRNTLINAILDIRNLSIDDDSAAAIVKEIDALSISDVKKQLTELSSKFGTNLLELAELEATGKIDDFRLSKKERLDGIDVADGASYVTDTFFEQMLRSVGEWNSEVERAFKILRGEEVDGKVYTLKDVTSVAQAYEMVMTKVIGTLKYTAYGQRKQSGWDTDEGYHEGTTMIPFYDKFALFPLFKIMCTGKMAHIYKAMVDQKVDMLKIKSAIKVGMEGSQPLDWSKWTDKNGDVIDDFHDSVKGFKFNTYTQRMKYLRKQFNTDPKDKEYLTMGTQMTKVVMLALTAGRDYFLQDGEKMSAKGLRDDVMNSMIQLAKIGNDKFRKEFFNEDGTVNLKAFSKMIKDELIRRGAGKDIIDGFTIVKETKIINGQPKTIERFKISPSAQSDINWIQSIIASAVNKRIVDINTPGNLFIQRSVWGMEGNTKIRGDENLPKSINGGNKLKLINEEGSMDCVLSIDFFEHILPKRIRRDSEGHVVYKHDGKDFVYKKNADGTDALDENGNKIRVPEYMPIPFDEAKQWLIDNGIISGVKTGETEWSNAKSSIVGYRIPTQAVSSIHAFRCVDVLPVVRDTVIMPEEITKVTGSDFDIDKMFLSTINYNIKDGKVSDEFKEGTAEYYQNKLIRDYIAMLINKGENGKPRNVQQLHGAIDKDTKLLKDTLKELESKGSQTERLTYLDYVLSNEVYIKRDFITGKNGIGPFALNNNNHILTMLYGVRFKTKPGSILTRLNLTRLDKAVDRDGKSIMSWLSGLINAHVDIAKDPYISRLGVNPFTYNMVNLLIRTGLGKTTFYFLTQPIMMLLAEVYSNATGIYNIDRTKSVSLLRRESRQQYIVNYINLNLGTDFTQFDYNDAIEAWKQTMLDRNININSAIDSLFHKRSTLMRDVSAKYKASGDKPGALDKDSKLSIQIMTPRGAETNMISMFDMQMLAYTAFEQFEPYAQALSSVVKYSKIDTKKQGKNITEQRAYKEGVYNTFENNRGIAKMFNANLHKMYEQSFIKQKTELALNAFSDILAPLMISATNQFNQQLHTILNVLNKTGESITEDIISDVTESMIQLIKSRYINEYAKICGIDIKGLVSGKNTMYDRLAKLAIDIKTKEEYQDLLMDGEINNYLLRSLVTALELEIDQDRIKEDGMQQDTYPKAKFIKLLNFLEDDNMDSDQLRSDWDALLNDGSYPEILKFVRDLIVYSFITTGDVGGGVKNLFKFVPNSWKLTPPEGYISYNEYMDNVLYQYNNNFAPDIDIHDLILNNWREYNFVPTFKISRKNGFRFLTYYPIDSETGNSFEYPIMLSGITDLEDGTRYPTFNEDPESERYYPSPKYLKIQRSSSDINDYSQRSFGVYKRVAFGRYTDEDGNTLVYPIYILVGPKGNVFEKGYKILEYDRTDQEYTEMMSAILKDKNLKDLLKDTKSNIRDTESLITELLQQYDKLDPESKLDETLKFIAEGYVMNNAFLQDGGMVIKSRYTRQQAELDVENMYVFTDNTDRSSGTNPVSQGSTYSILYSNGRQLFYPGTTTALIRGLDNAFPISTQHWYHEGKRGDAGRWTDKDYDEVVKTIESELLIIQQAWFSGIYKNIILPSGVNSFTDSKISQITEERTPKLYKYFVDVEERIRRMVELSEPMVEGENNTFKPGTHPGQVLLNLALDNTADLLLHISKNSKDSSYRLLAEKLFNFAKDNLIPIKYVHEGNKFNAHYVGGKNIIEINLDSDKIVPDRAEEIFLHETLHSLTSVWLNSHKEDAEKIMLLAQYVKSKINIEINPHVFENAKEFLTYATTDNKFRNVLKQIEPMDSNEYLSIFEQLLDNIKDIIHKIIGTTDLSVLDLIDPIVDKILNLQLEENNQTKNNAEDNIDDITLEDEHGNNYGWSVESIRSHLIVYVEQSTGYSEKQRRSHVKQVNKTYGTNFGVYVDKTTKLLRLKNSTIPVSQLNLSEFPGKPVQTELFVNDIKSTLRNLGEQLLKDCGY